MATSKKFKIATLGCRTNQYESQAYGAQLRAQGYTEVAEGEAADICIVNTCTVTASADQQSRQQLRRLARENPGAKLVVTGCAADRLGDASGALVVLNKDKERLLEIAVPEESWPEFKIDHFAAHTRAFVKVQDGCNSFCTYCIIPYVRGRSRSRKMDDILREIEDLVAHGYKEVVITGINVGDFEGEKGEKLADLVRSVDSVQGLKRLRISSIDPDEVDDNLASAVLEGKNTCPSMHIVLQSGSNVILKRMNRKYTRQVFLETVRRLKKARPDFTFTTDVIVGFPGETEGDFEETLSIIEEIQFAKVHMFPYSDRERTRSALYPNKVPANVIDERKNKVLRLSEQVAFSLRKSYVGREMEVLTEERGKGHTDNFLPVLVGDVSANELVRVQIVENTPAGLIGKRL
ncbi:MAG: tRNA (N(6)-L-threonylcarbamoyladenosine(37)-C(2))-methylthiotransferase MtaB [Verrucomicrobia bacterium]|nr:tRNA (N(6)-L-threonylcarbamoyladenosine(37)-C(2))-methylthiotransferase MtaB [Verrucomicrobiota bacterium]